MKKTKARRITVRKMGLSLNSRSGRGWAWLCDSGICHWATPHKDDLLREKKPSPEATPIAVRIIAARDYEALID